MFAGIFRKFTSLVLIGTAVLTLARAADDDSELRTKEALRLVHELRLAADFRERLNQTIDVGRERNPDHTLSYWDELRRLANGEKYLQFVVTTYVTNLSLAELQAINAVAGDVTKAKVMQALAALPKKLGAKETARYVDELKEKHGKELVDEVLNYALGPVALKLKAANREVDYREREYVIEAIRDAQRKIAPLPK